MRLTALWVFGTLLAFSSLSWITVKGVLLKEQGFRPCVATLRPDEACRPGQDESTCPYLFSLPPLTVHLPQPLRELEKIMQDLQKLKDSVEELREMCADCKVSPSECATQRQREPENLSKGKGADEDERNWMNVRIEENDRNVRQDFGKDIVKVEKMDGDNDADERLFLEEKDRKKWETDRRSDGGIIKEKEREETLTEGAEKERKTKAEGRRGREQEHGKVSTAGANERITDVIREKVVEKIHRETAADRNKNDAGKRNSKGYQDHIEENAGEEPTNTNVKNRKESYHHIWSIETKKTKEKTETEARHRIKMPDDHEENTNREQTQHKEEKRREMEEGIEMGKNNERPKDTESIGNIEKERTIKGRELDEEGRQMGKEIKTESVQKESDGELSSSKIIETTDLVSISPTLQSTMRLASSESRDSNKATIFTSSLPSPLLPSSTLSLITDVGHDTGAVYGPTQSTDLGAAGIIKPESFDAELATTKATTTTVGGPGGQITGEAIRSNSAFTVKTAAGLQGHATTTPTSSTTHEKFYISAAPRVTDRSRWTPTKNASSRATTVVKPLSGQGPKPGKKHKPGIKPEAKQKPNSPKSDRKPDDPLSPDKTKYNQRQKPSPFKPKTNIYKPGRDSEQIQNSKPHQRTPPDILVSDKNLRSNLTIKHYQDHKPDQDKTMIKKTESKKSPNPVQSPTAQKPQTVNTTLSDGYPSINGERESDDVRITDQNSKKDKKLAQTRKTDHPKHKQTPEKKILSEEKTKLHLFDNKNSEPVQEPESTKGGAASFTPKPNQKHFTQSVEKPKENTSLETKSNPDSTPGHKITSDGADATPDQELKSSQEILTTKQTPNPSQKNLTVSVNTLHESKSNPDSTTRPKIASDGDNATPDQKTESSQEILATYPTPKPNQKTEFNRSEIAKPNRKHLTGSLDKSNENPSHQPKSNEDSVSRQIPAPDRVSTPPAQKPEPTLSVPKINQTPKLGQVPKPSQRHPKPSTSKDLKSKLHTNLKPGQRPQTNPSLKISKPGQRPALKPISVTEKFPKAKPNKTSKPMPHSGSVQPTRPTVKPQGKPIQRPKPAEQPKIKLKTQTHPDPPHISRTTSHNIQNSHTDNPPASGLVKQSAEVTHSPTKDFRVSMRETITLGPKTFNSLETGLLPRLHTLPEDFMLSPNSRIISDLRPHTDGQPPSIPTTASPNKINHGILHSVITSTSPGSTQPRLVPKSDPGLQNNVEDTRPATQVPRPRSKTTSTLSPELRSETPTTSTPEPPAAEPSTSSARELRVKINQVAAFLNNTLIPNGRPVDMHLREHPRDTDRGSRPERTDSNLPTSVAAKVRRDCSDHLLRGETKSGVYLVSPDQRSRSFQVFCDMELQGGGWTLLQRRMDGSVSFNRTWAEYQSGFGRLNGGEFWLGNDRIHLLTRDRDMVLRVELEDFSGTAEHAQYQPFRVAGERLRYRLTVGAYSGTAGDALRFSRSYDHNHRAFTTPDRDNDRYPSGNCGAYYSSGWWFDACMAANLNGRYYKGTYKGVRDGIFWGTWHNISTEYYPTNDRQSFKTVRMMIRPKGFAP